MKTGAALMVIGALVCGTTGAYAAGASEKSPGDQMQDKGSVKGSPGASGYAPGHEMQNKNSAKSTTSKSPGASGYAPGRTTTGSGIQDKDDAIRRK
jgi:hypothetical protein